MNITLTLPGSVASPLLQRTQFFITLNTPGRDHAAGDRYGISGDLTNFSSRNWALCAVKGTQLCDEKHIDLTRQSAKSFFTTSAVLY
jgi:hypothetical protein